MQNLNIYFEGWLHHKNKLGIELMNSDLVSFHDTLNKDINWILNLSDFKNYDLKYLEEEFGIDINNIGFIYGPQIMFPAIEPSRIPKNIKYTCNVLSDWVLNLSKNINPNVNFSKLPFPINVNLFNSSLEKNGKPVIYFKYRNNDILNSILSELGNIFDIFNYKSGYKESDFLSSISNAPYCIWIGCHESQGFAFQETLSCNTPIFVIDVKSLRDEVRPKSFWVNYLPNHSLPATTASYFDDSCGLISTYENWKFDWIIFQSNLKRYTPREFIIKNISPEACRNQWIKTLNELNG